MSFRNTPIPGTRGRDLLRELEDRIYALEHPTNNGKISFGSSIQIGGVEITVSGGTSKTLTFRNVDTGSTSTITLP